ncbi:hypothetical protein IHE45_15G012200 [Dioscorea alata]|uniref:Uncharacterized protein n=1 Tax=Dioscorea alata TaxID=55571 RepID=A0ACB7UJS3_DIOAL|nr:hypothetical protein IHE45_15G012200 [Dioscorea alata]
MGTKVQCKSYMPGYYPMRGHDDDRNGNWSMFYDGSRAPNGHLYNAFMLKPMNGYSEYDKEMLKRTMLEHEAIFRKQVYELHRLYRIQKNLMDDLKRKESYRYSVQLDTSCSSQANSFSSQIQLEDSKRMLHAAHLPGANNCYSRAPGTAMDNLRFPVNFLKENQNGVRSGHSSVENGYSRKDDVPLESNSNRLARKMFDLQLPANVYIDDEESERSEKESAMKSSVKAVDFLNKTHSKELDNRVLLTLGTNAQSIRTEENHRLDSQHLRNGFTAHSFTDLNEPIKGSSSEVSACLSASYLFGPKTHNVDFLDSKLPLRANSNLVSLQKEYDRQKDEGASLNFTRAEMSDTRKELPLFRNDSGQIHDHVNAFGLGLCNEKSATSSQKVELKLNRTNGIKESDLNKMDTWFRQKLPDNIELSGANSHLAGLNKSRIQEPLAPNIMSVVPSGLTSTLSPMDSSWRKSMNSVGCIPFAIQALPHFDTSATMNSENWISNTQNNSSCGTNAHQNSPLDLSRISHFDHTSVISEKTKHNSNNNCNSAAFGYSGHSPQKSLKGLHCRDVKSVKGLNLNEEFTSGVQDDVAADGDSLTLDAKSKHEESSAGLSWLKNKPSFEGTTAKNNSKMELCSMQSYSQLLSSFTAPTSEFKMKQDKAIAVFAPSTLGVEESRMHRTEVSDNLSSKRILGFPIVENMQKTTACAHQSQSFTDDTKLNKREGLHHSENQSAICGENGSVTNNVSSRNHINLNFSACAESPKSSELPSGSSVPGPKLALEIDLEAPPICQPEDDMVFPGESSEVKQHSLPGYCSKEMENLHERCLREAAESIVAISLDACSNGNEGTCRESSPAGSDALCLLAEVVLSNSEEELKERSSQHANALYGNSDGLDLFELMTLNLKEMKEDEYWCPSQEPVNQKEEENGAAALLLAKPRRGQARKRRQKRDFQKDILPGLASLARHEVTEDLQVIGGLMRASGRSWQAGLTRRNNGRNGTQTQAKGRQRPRRQQPETVPEIVVSHQAEVDPKAIIGWGRTIRRCRRSRCTLGNVSTPLT